MARVQKLYNRLDALEAEIRRRLVPALRAVADGQKTTFFTAAAYSPFPAWLNCSETEALLALADEARALRDQLGEPAAGAVGERLRAYCRQATDVSDHNRLGPRRLAGLLLAELGEPAGPCESPAEPRVAPDAGRDRR